MPIQVVNGALLKCAMAVPPGTSPLTVLPVNRVMSGNQPAANILDHVPMVNIKPFGMCMTPSNPAVASATAAASGVLTPMPCVPVTPAPWIPGASNVLLGNMPALDNTCTCMCTWGGVITVAYPGQVTEMIP
ncbi:MAG TPA: DUF4280 domain-containing protein [Thermomonas sp.]|nr:DUF4280 domain-containing protein [Thermomonas sp.]